MKTIRECIDKCFQEVETIAKLKQFLETIRDEKIELNIAYVVPSQASVVLNQVGDPHEHARYVIRVMTALGFQCSDWLATPGGLGSYNWEMHCNGIKFKLNSIQYDVPQIVKL